MWVAFGDGNRHGGDGLPWGAQLPATGPAVFFSLAAVWFVTLALVPAETVPLRAVYGYHALMMLAMAWMYTFIHGLLLPGRSSMHHDTAMDMAGKVGADQRRVTGLDHGDQLVLVRRVRGRRGLLDVRFRSEAAGWVDRRMVAFAQYAGSSDDGRRDALSCSAPRYFRPEPTLTPKRFGHPWPLPAKCMSTGD